MLVPFVFEFGELFGGVFGAEGEVLLCVVGLVFYEATSQPCVSVAKAR